MMLCIPSASQIQSLKSVTKKLVAMGRVSDNRIKFSKPSLKAIERRIDRGEFTKEFYLYHPNSQVAIRVI